MLCKDREHVSHSVVIVLASFQLFWTIGLFDYFQVKGVWIKFWWRDSTMAWFRYHFCKAETANTRCAAPVFVNDTDVTVRSRELFVVLKF